VYLQIGAFVSQLSGPGMGFSVGKLFGITWGLLGGVALGVGMFFAFARITISACTARRSN
jgi:hypothetical protein